MTALACVVGSGPNGLAAAIALAQAGLKVDVFEAEEVCGGGARTLELTLPGYRHDFGSAVHPLAAGSPFFLSLNLARHGLAWAQPPAALAHPFDDGTAATLERGLEDASASLGRAWRRLMEPFAADWPSLAAEVLSPVPHIPRHPGLLARFATLAVLPASLAARMLLADPRSRALFAGLAGHSSLSLRQPLSSGVALLLGAAAHAVGWPIPLGGSQSITDALLAEFAALGGTATTGRRVESLDELGGYGLKLLDVTPRQLLAMGRSRFSSSFTRSLAAFRYGSGAFKVDYALSEPIPWRAEACRRAATVHLGGSIEEIEASEETVRRGEPPQRPFVVVTQPSLFDAGRAPAGRHTAWAYCHVPNAQGFDMLPRLEAQLERFAPGFRDVVSARRVLRPADLERMDANLVGGDINGGALDWRQFALRPTRRLYATSAPDVFICSSSTPPGGGVHGMCGYHAAQVALSPHPPHRERTSPNRTAPVHGAAPVPDKPGEEGVGLRPGPAW